MMHLASLNWASVDRDPQTDWIDRVISIENWLEDNVGERGDRWDWCNNVEFAQVGFVRERDCMWFKLQWG